MSTERALRVSQSIKRELADMLRRDLKDPRLSGLISITEVETTSDLRNVKVFVSVFGTSSSVAASVNAYESTTPEAKKAAQKLTASGAPELTKEEKPPRVCSPASMKNRATSGENSAADSNCALLRSLFFCPTCR